MRQYLNLLITMTLGGLWHGAGWTFVLWGTFHGALLALNHAWRRQRISLPRSLGVALTFVAVVFGWVLFRAGSPGAALTMMRSMVGLGGPGVAQMPDLGLRTGALVLVGVVALKAPNTRELIDRFEPNVVWVATAVVLGTLCVLQMSHVSEFLYFQF